MFMLYYVAGYIMVLLLKCVASSSYFVGIFLVSTFILYVVSEPP